MGIKEFAAKAETVLQGIGDLNTPIRGLTDPHFEKETRQEAEADVNLQKIGSVKLKGAIEADVHLTKAAAPPLALDAFVGDPSELDHAYASLVVSATAEAGLAVKERVSANLSLNAGAEANARYALAHHLRVSQDREALDALVDFVRDLKTPYTASDIRDLGEDEVLQVEFDGSGVFRASAGWGYAFSRQLDGENLEKLIENCYKAIQLPENVRVKLKDRFEQELLKRESNTIQEQQFITRRMTKLADQRLKLMDAYYDEAIPLEVLKKEQNRISGEMEDCQGRLEVLKAGDDDIKSMLNLALDMASKCHVAYTKASPKVRRMFNQAFFKKVSIKNKKVSELHYTSLFALFFDPGLNKEDLVAGAGFEPATFGL